MFDLSVFRADALGSKFVASAVVVVLAIVVQTALRQGVLRHMAQSDLRRRWIVSIRNSVILLASVALASIWIDELRSVATAIVAFAVAFVIATKEFILCINGALLRTATNAYAVGDRIEIGGYRGDVIDFTLLSTTLLEVGPGRHYHLRTGRTIVFPNSKLLDSYLINESSMKPFVVHVVSVPIQGDWRRAQQALLEAAEIETASYLEQARAHMNRLEHEHGLEGLPVQPRVDLQIPEAGKMNLLLRIPTPIGRQGRVEQAILRAFLERMESETASGQPSPNGSSS